MSPVSSFVLVLCLICPILAQKFCRFNGPQDLSTLQGSNYIQNVGSGNSCLKMLWFGAIYRVPMVLDSCQWNTPGVSKDQLFLVKNGNGGVMLKPKKDNSQDFCLSLDGRNLLSLICSPKNDDQTWIVKNVGRDTYQIIQKSSGKCLRASSSRPNSAVQTDYCRSGDGLQQWKICTAY